MLSRQKLNLLKAKIYNKMNQIDMGIVSAFAEVVLRKAGKNSSFYVTPDHLALVKEGYEYFLTCQWEEQ